jgi:hypothetical protein
MKMGTNLLCNLTKDIDSVVEGMSPEVEKKVRLHVVAQRIRDCNHHSNGNSRQTNYRNNEQNNVSASHIDLLINGHKNARFARDYSQQEATEPKSKPAQASHIPKPKEFLEIKLPLSPEFLEKCAIRQNVRFETKFGDNICQVTGSIANKYDDGIAIDKIKVNGPSEPYRFRLNKQWRLHLPEQPNYAPA